MRNLRFSDSQEQEFEAMLPGNKTPVLASCFKCGPRVAKVWLKLRREQQRGVKELGLCFNQIEIKNSPATY